MSSLNNLMYQTILPFLSRQKQQFSICIIFQSRKIPCSYIEVKNKQLSQFCYLTHGIKSCIPEKSSCNGYNIAAFGSSHHESMFDKHIYEIGEYLGMAKLNFMEGDICQRKHVHDIIVNRKHSSYFPYFLIPFLFVYKNLYIISSSIEKFFMSTKTFILSKTEQNYIFHRILFSGH